MDMWILIPVLLVVAFFVVATLLQRRYRRRRTVSTEKKEPFLRGDTVALSMNRKDVLTGEVPERNWWMDVSSLQRLQLALHLAEKAMPVWEKFTSSQVVFYRAATAGPLTIIESDLLQRTVEIIAVHAQLHFPLSDAVRINQYHKRFIGPVLALKDGMWICNYPVKKIFLSVYFILMSIVDRHSSNVYENFLSEAINAVLECMELSKLYTREEITSLLENYRYSL